MNKATAMEILSAVRIAALAHRQALDLVNYEGMTCPGAHPARARAAVSAAVSSRLRELLTDDLYYEALSHLDSRVLSLDPLTRAEAKLALREAEDLRGVPAEAYSEHSRAVTEAFAAWQRAKAESAPGLLAPRLERVFQSARRIAECAAPGLDPYDYWLGKNEPGADTASLDRFFDLVERELRPLIAGVSQREKPDNSFLHGHFPIEKQREFSRRLMLIMGIDPERCTIAEAEHPYTTVLSRRDVRITTHYHEDHADANMFTVLHEGGHALYALNLSPELDGTALSFASTAGMNEAISRFYENIIGRSEGFAELITPVLKGFFPGEFGSVTPRMLYLAVNRAEPTLKRTEADELTYPMHILIRYRLERALMSGELAVRELPSAWNELYKSLLGIEPPDDRAGCLQDMHWASGLIGYFPTYALGNAYGAQLYYAIRKDLDPDEAVRGGNMGLVTEWLRERIMKHGRLKSPAELIRGAAGEDFDPKHYVRYLKEKYGRLYGV